MENDDKNDLAAAINEWLDLVSRKDVMEDLLASSMGMPVSAFSGSARANLLMHEIAALIGDSEERLFGQGELFKYMDASMRKRFIEIQKRFSEGL